MNDKNERKLIGYDEHGEPMEELNKKDAFDIVGATAKAVFITFILFLAVGFIIWMRT